MAVEGRQGDEMEVPEDEVHPERSDRTLAEGGEELDIDAANFNPVQYLNRLFPDEASLSGMDDFLIKLRRRIRKVNDEIVVAVRQQSQTGSRAKEDLRHAQAGIQDLSGRISEIKLKAEQSETKAQEICRDIKKLDYAKRHLTNTITAFRRLSMLMSAIQNLQEVADKRDYRETANLLEAVNQLASHFESFSQIPKICELKGQLSAIKSALRATIFEDFLQATSRDDFSPEDLDKFSHACRVVEAVDSHVKGELISRICNKEMSAYQQIFSTNEAPSVKLEKTERRYAWMKKLLHRKQPFLDVFPKAWQVSHTMCLTFCKITKAHLSETLDAQREDPDVANLLKALHCTLDFEKELNGIFGEGDPSVLYVGEDDAGDADEGEELSEAQQVRRKYESMRKTQAPGPKSSGEGKSQANTVFLACISPCFEPHLKCYVELEEKSLRETIDNLIKEEKWEPESTENDVLSSSVQVFLRMKKSLKRCSSLTKGQTLFDLSQCFQRVLQSYSMRLTERLPRNGANRHGGMASTTSTEWHVKLGDEKEEKVVCLIINTSEYCYETVEQLGQSIAKMLEKQFSNQVDMSQAQDEFSGVITTALSTLVMGLETRMDQALSAMVKMNWAAVDTVGDQSEYVNIFSSVLADSIPRLGSYLSQSNFRYLCDKFTASFIPRFYLTVFKCKKLSDSGAQQLLLDAQAVRTLLLDLPSLGNHPLPPSYSRTVTQEMSKSENLLKVILSPPDAILTNFFALMPSNAVREVPQILELKGLKKNEQQVILDEMQKRGMLGGESSESPTQSSGNVGVGSGSGSHRQQGNLSSRGGSEFQIPKFDKFKLKSDFMQLQGRFKASTDFSKIRNANSGRAGEALKKLQSKLTFGQ